MELIKGNKRGVAVDYTIMVGDLELESIVDEVLVNLNLPDNVNSDVKDVLVEEYVRHRCASFFMNNERILKGAIYNIRVATKNMELNIMLTHNDALDEIVY